MIMIPEGRSGGGHLPLDLEGSFLCFKRPLQDLHDLKGKVRRGVFRRLTSAASPPDTALPYTWPESPKHFHAQSFNVFSF